MSEPYWEPLAAAAAPSPRVLIAEAIVTTPAMVTFASIPQTYRHLKIEGRARGGQAVPAAGLQLRINNDSGSANYYWEQLSVQGTAVTASSGSASAMNCGGIQGGQAGADDASTVEIFLPYYATTDARKPIRTITTTHAGLWVASAEYVVNDAITRLDFYDPGGNLTDPTRLCLYGIA